METSSLLLKFPLQTHFRISRAKLVYQKSCWIMLALQFNTGLWHRLTANLCTLYSHKLMLYCLRDCIMTASSFGCQPSTDNFATSTNAYIGRAFAVARLSMWNSLPNWPFTQHDCFWLST